ncbi:unnamed protein product [Arabidopsis lyrata]|nr:unnamed protein product [Arabidopsis lyrata]
MDGRQMKFERVGESDFLKTFTYQGGYGSYSSGESTKVIIENAVLWVDERSRDYLVVWSLECFFAYHKKGDNNKSWKVFQLKKNQGCSDMVFRESKLYVLSPSLNITIFDFSCGGSPNECASFTTPDGLTLFPLYGFGHLVITLSGEVLMIKPRAFAIPSFDIYKMDPKSSKWREIYSLGNEALLLDLGTTVAAKDGFGENSLYFSNRKPSRYNGSCLCNENSNYVYDFLKRLVVQRFQHLADLSPVPFKDSRWFFPTFCGKSLL